MVLQTLDWLIIALFFVLYLVIGLFVSRKAGQNAAEFFLSGRNMPWWLLGVSMVATTFSTDTPNLVTDIVRQNGIAGNWVWWAFLLTGMLTVFVYARLWRRSGVLTDLEFYEIRYGGKAAAFLRGFRALYLGVVFNIMIMASVSLAMIKIGGVMLGLSPVQTLILASTVTVLYSTMGGLRSILITDLVQFAIAMIGAIGAAWFVLDMPEIGGLSQLLTHPNVSTKLNFIPDFNDSDLLITVFILPLAVQWWSVWYPGSEPGGGGYLVQRMLSAKNESHAVGATLFFNVAHYAMRPWPWIIVALSSLVVFPNIQALQQAFPNVNAQVMGHDLAYPAMLTFLPTGFLGLVIASLIAAFMSTISTHLNWGASYIVHDFYRRFINANANESQLVFVGRIATVGLMVITCIFALMLSNALQAFHILLQIGAGTGLLFILRWFWWRINPYSEITAMVVSFTIAIYFEIFHTLLGFAPLTSNFKMLFGVGITTVAWFIVTLVTQPSDAKTLQNFIDLINPGGPGWKNAPVKKTAKSDWDVPHGLICMLLGSISVYCALFGTGYYIYDNLMNAAFLWFVSLVTAYLLFYVWKEKYSISA
ncbi:MAG: Na+:solute symporter [Deferribacteres bacterium]|nr:Na+:solute symporter [candidate division KSB1 bacterium]MCB9501326.1 Na+:solute symporter [Deferribacteres bacterium]